MRRIILFIIILCSSIFLSACRPSSESPPTHTGSPIISTATPNVNIAVSPTDTQTSMIYPTESATECLQTKGAITEDSITSDQIEWTLFYYIYLPPCYDPERSAGYPVLYLIHGQSYTHDQWVNLGMTDVADTWITEGKSEPFIIVLPQDRVWEQPSINLFGEVLIKELIPLIDTTFNTDETQDGRAIGGLSRGASWTVHLAIKYPELFIGIGAHSLPVFYEDVNYVQAWLETTPVDDLPLIYVDSPDGDFENIRISTRWFVDQLVFYDIPHEYYVFVGYHVEDYWSAHVENYFEFYSELWNN